MLRKIFIGSLYCFLLVVLPTSCKKFLNEKPTNAITTPQTIADLQALLDDAGTVMNLNVTPCFGEAAADDYFVLPAYYKTTSVSNQHFYIWKTYDYSYPNDWSKGYAPIYHANYCLDMLSKQARNESNSAAWNNVYGSAKFFRAYYFLLLSWVYAQTYDEASANKDPGIVLRLVSDFNVPSTRASVEECYQQVITDTKEAADYLPNLPAHVYRPSKAAAYGLLARTYLTMRSYDSAYKYADLCLQLKNDLMDFNNDADVLAFSTTYPLKKFNKETIFYTEMNTGFAYDLVLTTRSKVDTGLYKQYEEADLRKKGWFIASEGFNRFRGNYTQSSIPFTGLATDEIYLIRAECNARKGNTMSTQASLKDLNLLLSKRYLNTGFTPVSELNGKVLISRIITERRKELLFRGLRWPDIKRLNKEGESILLTRTIDGSTYMLEPNAAFYALPLPTDIVNLTGINQNKY